MRCEHTIARAALSQSFSGASYFFFNLRRDFIFRTSPWSPLKLLLGLTGFDDIHNCYETDSCDDVNFDGVSHVPTTGAQQ